jgi:hypothetical protein
MTEACHSNAAGGANCDDEGAAAALGIVRWLSLAAAPTFAIMALLSAVVGSGPLDTLCSAANASPVGGMVPMYLLMSAFHSAPWLKLIASRLSWIGEGRAARTTMAVSGVGKLRANAICDARGANLMRAALLNGTRPDDARTPKPELRYPSEKGT